MEEFRRFHLVRLEDLTGISGTGVVAEGCHFSNQKCVLSWVTKYQSVAVYDDIFELINVHGRDGKTIVRWVDEE